MTISPLAVVERHEGLIQRIAAEHATDLVPFDDLAQEGRAVLWDEAHARPGDTLDKLASFILNRRLYNVTRHNRMLGATDGQRHWEPSVEVWVDGLAPDAREHVETQRGTAPSAEDVALRRIEDADVRAAIDALPDARVRAVAHGHLAGEPSYRIAEALGVSETTARNLWNRKARPALAEALYALTTITDYDERALA